MCISTAPDCEGGAGLPYIPPQVSATQIEPEIKPILYVEPPPQPTERTLTDDVVRRRYGVYTDRFDRNDSDNPWPTREVTTPEPPPSWQISNSFPIANQFSATDSGIKFIHVTFIQISLRVLVSVFESSTICFR